ncbi:putative serine/threonine protein kinase ENV7 PWA37_000472 [Arxiozyma heterogenica]|uniref:putative serine/threonine protein kinase ENV7 n=1 Tax=Arxiozyma heterogenica TaxID=278026 RepID=UPI002F0E2479
MLESIIDTICSCCYPIWDHSNSYITVNGRKYRLNGLLSENTLSFTYMVSIQNASSSVLIDQDFDTNRLVLKQIICPFGNIENISDALTEIKNYKTYNSKYIIKYIDSEVLQSYDGSKTVVILLPYYPRGPLKDLLSLNILNGVSSMSEKEIVRLMIGICKGLLILHDPTTNEEFQDEEDETSSVFMEIDRDAASYLIDTPLEMGLLSSPRSSFGSLIHLDIEPSSILLSNEGTPIISQLVSIFSNDMEFKSDVDVARFKEWVSCHCNIYYTAPEVINIKKNSMIDCSVDIWSLGCVLYTLMFGISPFDREEQINGLSLQHNISNGLYSIPQDAPYSQALVDIIKSCLKIDAILRPTTNELLTQLQTISI